MDSPPKGVLDYAKDGVLGIFLAIAGIITAWIRTRPKSEATQSSESQAFAKFGVDMTEKASAYMTQEIVALRARVSELEVSVKELQKLWGDEREESARLASELKSALEENRRLREENAELRVGNHRRHKD